MDFSKFLTDIGITNIKLLENQSGTFVYKLYLHYSQTTIKALSLFYPIFKVGDKNNTICLQKYPFLASYYHWFHLSTSFLTFSSSITIHISLKKGDN